ncbi:MAG: ribosome silencing factor [Candidatus Tectomicrobia bacterium]|nr:ribosome silencing factor [Candidatus Tectomicrobia bacterium]
MTLEEKTLRCSEAALEKKAHNVVVLDVRTLSSVTDYFFICSGNSGRQVQAIADAIHEILKKEGVISLGTEGYQEAKWVLIDYADLVIHIFYDEIRTYYDLESLWGEAPRVELKVS